MLVESCFGTQLVILLLLIHSTTSVPKSDSPCNWKLDADCWLLCTGSDVLNVTHDAEDKWSERPHCHAEGIALGLFGIKYPNFTVSADWFKARIKVKYLEFGTATLNYMEDSAFNADAFKSVTHLTVPKMDVYELKKGLFNGLESLQILNLKAAAFIQSVGMGILDGLNQTLQELTIESDRNRYMNRALPIESFTGSQQALSLEFVRVRYRLNQLTSKSFTSLTKVKYFDLANCFIQNIEEGTFDPLIHSINILRLTDNQFTNLPAGMLDLVPLSYDMYIFVGLGMDCECNNLPINFIAKVNCDLKSAEADEVCTAFLPIVRTTTTDSITTITPTIVPISSTTEEYTSVPTTETESTTIETESTTTETESTTTKTEPTTTEVSTILPPALPVLTVQLKEFKSGDVTVYVNGSIPVNSTLFLFVSRERTEQVHTIVNCTSGQWYDYYCSMTVNHLLRNTKYTFCVTGNGKEWKEFCTQYKTRHTSYFQLWLEKVTFTMIVIAVMFVVLPISFVALLCKLAPH